MQDAYATGTRLLAFLLFPAGWGAAAIMPSLLPALFGPSFATAVPSAMVLVTIGCMGASVTIGSLLIYAMGRSEIIFRQGLLGAILTLTSGLIIVPHYGLLGAVWARAVIQLLMIGIGMYFIAVQLKCPVPFKSLTKILISAIISALAAHAIIRFIHGIPGICVAVPVGAIVYFAAVWISGGLTTSDNERLLALANDLGKSLIRFRPRLP
jgi:O-antigen/teichoic acid export membrane protein